MVLFQWGGIGPNPLLAPTLVSKLRLGVEPVGDSVRSMGGKPGRAG